VDDDAVRRPGVLARLRAATAGGPLGNRSFQLLSMGQLAPPSATCATRWRCPGSCCPAMAVRSSLARSWPATACRERYWSRLAVYWPTGGARVWSCWPPTPPGACL